MSSKKSHREKLARTAAASAPPVEPGAAPAEPGWPRERFDMDALGKIEHDGVRGYAMGRVFQNQDGSVYAVFPEGTQIIGEVEFSYESHPAQDACQDEPAPSGGSRYKRGRRWWEQDKWERSR